MFLINLFFLEEKENSNSVETGSFSYNKFTFNLFV